MRVPARTTGRGALPRASSPSSEGQVASRGATPPEIAACAHEVADAITAGRPVALACGASAEGVLAATGVTYLAHVREGQVRLARAGGFQPALGEEVVHLPSDTRDGTALFARRVLEGWGHKVTSGCRRMKKGLCPANCQGACLGRLALVCASDDPQMPEVAYRYLRLGFSVGPAVRSMIADERVAAFTDIARFVSCECEHTRQFVRFSRMADGSFWATFKPRANTVPLTAAHFATRMGTERFCLVDPVHRMAAFHEPGQPCTLARLDRPLAQELSERRDLAEDEPYVRALWKRFYDKTALPGRDRSQRGYDLRTHWMPQRLWEGLTELDPRVEAAAQDAGARHELLGR